MSCQLRIRRCFGVFVNRNIVSVPRNSNISTLFYQNGSSRTIRRERKRTDGHKNNNTQTKLVNALNTDCICYKLRTSSIHVVEHNKQQQSQVVNHIVVMRGVQQVLSPTLSKSVAQPWGRGTGGGARPPTVDRHGHRIPANQRRFCFGGGGWRQ